MSHAYPKCDVKKFDGSSEQYLMFEQYIRDMESKIHDDGNRLTFLIDKVCVGQAYSAVCMLIKRQNKTLAYVEAKQRLKMLFGSQSMIIKQ